MSVIVSGCEVWGLFVMQQQLPDTPGKDTVRSPGGKKMLRLLWSDQHLGWGPLGPWSLP